MGWLFGRGTAKKVARRDKATAAADARRASKETAALRKQIAHDSMNPARATTRQISENMSRIDRQLVSLEKLRRQVDTNREAHGTLTAETARLREQRRGLREVQRAARKQKALSKPARRKLLGVF